ncbi:von Willebrand factor C and EGF domain-containing protein-like isoform X2 [Cuculus canorus]|uniref:von Willebrand factor C and EGF domain-containing protein-like isoform X2 n=1 Tax=Cuculus canorus TaxID=55661 RepID=UPI0023AA530A|nr:von Willebrand factor C and EGF domain-containing protein-like isoform X2 [Cuculus canorus]
MHLPGRRLSCKRTDCVKTCPYPILIPGQCCPNCSAGCNYVGRIFYNNETFPSVLDPCLSCICLLGSVACSPVDCAIFCTYPFHPEGECCPVCNDCNYQGRKVVNGQTFIPEGQPCTRCTCQVSSGVSVGCLWDWGMDGRDGSSPNLRLGLMTSKDLFQPNDSLIL